MRKLPIVALLAAVLSLGVLSGCEEGGQGEAPQQPAQPMPGQQ